VTGKQTHKLDAARRKALIKFRERNMRKYGDTEALSKNPAKRADPDGPPLAGGKTTERGRATFVPKKDA